MMAFRKTTHLIAAASIIAAALPATPGWSHSSGPAPSPTVSPERLSDTCSTAALTAMAGGGVTISSVVSITDGASRCRVRGTVATAGDGAPPGSARFELNLPTNWNRKFIFLGGGGFDGNIPQASAAQLAQGYATLGTDSGHIESALYPSGGLDASWGVTPTGVRDDAKLADYAYRSRHQVNGRVRPIVAAFYGGEEITRAYFIGCSGGGREALIEAQRHPEDYDGFIAGDPLVSAGTPLLGARNFRLLTDAPIAYAKFAAIQAAVLDECDKKDGVTDGLIQNPAMCGFDPNTLVRSGVLTRAQGEALAGYLTAPTDSTGRRIAFAGSVSGLGDLSGAYPGMTGGLTGLTVYLSDQLPAGAGSHPWGPLPKGPVNWLLFNGAVSTLGLGRPDLSILDPSVSGSDGRIAAGIAHGVEAGLANAHVDTAAMGRFFASGKKLIIYHGYDDSILDPYATIDAYRGMVVTAGGLAKAQASARLFMAPGMSHCFGGTGPSMFDALGALEAWVEQGNAPESIIAYKFKNNVPGGPIDRSMPLCPFPQAARFDGKGDATKASSWSCTTDDTRLLEAGPNGIAAGVATTLAAFR